MTVTEDMQQHTNDTIMIEKWLHDGILPDRLFRHLIVAFFLRGSQRQNFITLVWIAATVGEYFMPTSQFEQTATVLLS